MGLILKQLFQFIKLLNSDTGTNQIASGIAAGFILGMTPVFSLQTLLVFVFIFAFRIQIGAAFIFAFFFKFIAYLLDPVFHEVGLVVLSNQNLKPLFTELYNMPIVPLTRFYNTIVMGSGVTSLLLSPFVFVLSKKLVVKYREKVLEKFKQTKFWKAVQATSFYKWYYQYDELYG
jgi:uncharacterized protein (TIGR03546 family)